MSTIELRRLSLTTLTFLVILVVAAFLVVGLYYVTVAYPVAVILGGVGWWCFFRILPST